MLIACVRHRVRARRSWPLAIGLFLIAGGTFSASLALAQGVPAHAPGTVCYTPQFWCWAQPPGPPGSPCVCPSPYGFVGGMRG